MSLKIAQLAPGPRRMREDAGLKRSGAALCRLRRE